MEENDDFAIRVTSFKSQSKFIPHIAQYPARTYQYYSLVVVTQPLPSLNCLVNKFVFISAIVLYSLYFIISEDMRCTVNISSNQNIHVEAL